VNTLQTLINLLKYKSFGGYFLGVHEWKHWCTRAYFLLMLAIDVREIFLIIVISGLLTDSKRKHNTLFDFFYFAL